MVAFVTWLPAATLVSAGWPPTCGRIGQGIGPDCAGIHFLDLDRVRSHGIANGNCRLGDEHPGRWSLTVRVIGRALAIEDHDDADECEDGQQHADEDDETIGSLHETFPLQFGRRKNG